MEINMLESQLSAEALNAIEHYRMRARAANTCRTYARQWTHFVAWCNAQTLSPLPADAEVVAAYLGSRAQNGA